MTERIQSWQADNNQPPLFPRSFIVIVHALRFLPHHIIHSKKRRAIICESPRATAIYLKLPRSTNNIDACDVVGNDAKHCCSSSANIHFVFGREGGEWNNHGRLTLLTSAGNEHTHFSKLGTLEPRVSVVLLNLPELPHKYLLLGRTGEVKRFWIKIFYDRILNFLKTMESPGISLRCKLITSSICFQGNHKFYRC